MEFGWIDLFLVVAVATLAAMGGVTALTFWQTGRVTGRAGSFDDALPGAAFLFDGESLIDATPGGRALLAHAAVRGTAWQRLMAFLGPRFPGVEESLARLPEDGRFHLAAQGGGNMTLQAEWRGGIARLTLAEPDRAGGTPMLDPFSQRALEEELALSRDALAQAPVLTWKENPGGEVIWANAAYLAEAGRTLDPEVGLTWPLPRLFAPPAGDRARLRLDRKGAAPAWFDMHGTRSGPDRLLFALPADALVQAETALRDFMQTLTKTFAHLPIGLAIFDRQRRLALFNPALLDLTGLQPDFLSARPTLFAVLDAMRERRMIPEPKDYRSWRRQMAELEKAAASGRYEETWNLPGGQTYRVIGRPHPDGAMALLFEDISTEVSRTRRYRADVELGQTVLDAMPEAVAVFAAGGVLVMSNAAYAALWGHDPGATLGDAGIATLAASWRGLTAPTTVWTRAEEFVATLGDRTAWSDETRLNDGRRLVCRCVPLPGGATMLAFQAGLAAEDAPVPFVTHRTRRIA